MFSLNPLVPATLWLSCLWLTNGEHMKLRILLNIKLEEEALKQAHHFGQLATFMNDVACKQLIEDNRWLHGCQVIRYHISKDSENKAVVLVESETSNEADRELQPVCDQDTKLFLISQMLNFEEVQFAVDIPRDKHGACENIKFTYDGLVQTRTAFTYFVEVGGLDINENIFEELKEQITLRLQEQLKTVLGRETRNVHVLPLRLLQHTETPVVATYTHFHTALAPNETGFPEQWKMCLQGVINSLDIGNGLGRNFKLSVYQDDETENVLKVELSMFIPEYERHLHSRTAPSIECSMIDRIFTLLDLTAYACYPWGYRISESKTDLYARVRLQLSLPMVRDALREPSYSDIAFLGLMKRKCEWAVVSLFRFRGDPTYAYYSDPNDSENFVIVWEQIVAHHDRREPPLRNLNSLAGRRMSAMTISTTLSRKLEVPACSIRCTDINFVPLGDRVILETKIYIQKSNCYWNEEEPWLVPLRISYRLRTLKNIYLNVRWRQAKKYAVREDTDEPCDELNQNEVRNQ